MNSIPVSELQRDLAGVLRRVQAGEVILVTDQGRPVAKLAPADASDDATISSGDLVFRSPRAPLPDDFWDRPRPEDPDGSVRQALIEDRNGDL